MPSVVWLASEAHGSKTTLAANLEPSHAGNANVLDCRPMTLPPFSKDLCCLGWVLKRHVFCHCSKVSNSPYLQNQSRNTTAVASIHTKTEVAQFKQNVDLCGCVQAQ